jgi:hypothetical protein
METTENSDTAEQWVARLRIDSNIKDIKKTLKKKYKLSESDIASLSSEVINAGVGMGNLRIGSHPLYNAIRDKKNKKVKYLLKYLALVKPDVIDNGSLITLCAEKDNNYALGKLFEFENQLPGLVPMQGNLPYQYLHTSLSRSNPKTWACTDVLIKKCYGLISDPKQIEDLKKLFLKNDKDGHFLEQAEAIENIGISDFALDYDPDDLDEIAHDLKGLNALAEQASLLHAPNNQSEIDAEISTYVGRLQADLKLSDKEFTVAKEVFEQYTNLIYGNRSITGIISYHELFQRFESTMQQELTKIMSELTSERLQELTTKLNRSFLTLTSALRPKLQLRSWGGEKNTLLTLPGADQYKSYFKSLTALLSSKLISAFAYQGGWVARNKTTADNAKDQALNAVDRVLGLLEKTIDKAKIPLIGLAATLVINAIEYPIAKKIEKTHDEYTTHLMQTKSKLMDMVNIFDQVALMLTKLRAQALVKMQNPNDKESLFQYIIIDIKGKLSAVKTGFETIARRIKHKHPQVESVADIHNPVLLATADAVEIAREIYHGNYVHDKYNDNRLLRRSIVARVLKLKVEDAPALDSFLNANPSFEPQLEEETARINMLELQVEVLSRSHTALLAQMESMNLNKGASPA